MPDMATDYQRWEIFHLFEHFGIKNLTEMHATAEQILKLDFLPDLRELTKNDADELIGNCAARWPPSGWPVISPEVAALLAQIGRLDNRPETIDALQRGLDAAWAALPGWQDERMA